MAGTEKKNSTKFQIINYIINHKATSKVELSRNLNLSMPTVLSNVNELLASGIVVEMGEYESTGGRKAKMISINPAYRYAVGIRITAKLKSMKESGWNFQQKLLIIHGSEKNCIIFLQM